MKKKTPQQEIKELCGDIRKEIEHWKDINKNGCNDPFWSDGANMNLTRNHIIYDKYQIAELCTEHHLTLPEEMYLPLPPEVNKYYMANPKQERRVERIGRDRITTKRNRYDERQLSFW